MKLVYWPCLIAAVAFLIWTHTHTDEIPIVLGIVLIVSALLAMAFPREFAFTGLFCGGAIFIAETLVHFSILPAPYPPAAGIPWPALFGYLPALFGVGIGVGVRRMFQTNSAAS
jgi:hypothetical protein